MTALAPWVTDVELADEARLANVNLPTGITLADLCDAATEELWRLSGARYDARSVTVRPHRLVSHCTCIIPFDLSLSGSGQVNGFGTFGPGWGGCRCDHGSSFELRFPVSAVTSVTVDGAALAENVDWILADQRLLVRIGRSWPCCQNLSTPDGSPGTWSVAYTYGSPPPVAGRLAAREMVIAMALDASGKPNKLPSRTESVTRQGVSASINDASSRNAGRPGWHMPTGILAIDRFLASVNPYRLQRAPQSTSPDSLVGAE